MIVKSLKATQFMRFESFDLRTMPERGLTGIFGDNECGKSTIGELICYSLFGRTPKAQNGEPRKIVRWGQDTCSVQITFSSGRESYRILRRLSVDGTRDGRMIKLSDNGVIAVNADEIESRVNEILGYSFREFRYSMFIAQKELDIMLHSAEDRKLVLNNMLGVGFMEKAAKRTAAKREDREADFKSVRTRLEDKREVLEVYLARKRDMDQLDRKMNESDQKLLEYLRERDTVKSTISMLEDIRRKAEQVEILDIRIKNRREQLRQIEQECSRLMRDSDRVPGIHREISEKQDRIKELRDSGLGELREKFKLLEEYRELAGKRDQVLGQLEIKETALSELTRKLEAISAVESEIREYEMEHQSIDYFLEAFAGADRFRGLTSHLMKDVELLNSEIDRAKTLVRRDLEMVLERENAFKRQQERIRRQIDASTIDEVGPDRILQLRTSEQKQARTRDIALGFSAAFLILGVVLTLILNNVVFLAVLIGIIPCLGAGIMIQTRVRGTRDIIQELQRQSYAFNITQRGIFELKEAVDEAEEKLESIKQETTSIEDLLRRFDNVKTDSFPALERTIEFLDRAGIRELERARTQMKDLLSQYDTLRGLVEDNLLFVQIAALSPDDVISEKQQRRGRLEEMINALREKTTMKEQLSEQSEGLLNSIGALRTQITRVEAGMATLGVTDEEEPALIQKEKSIYEQVENLQLQIEQSTAEIARIEEQVSNAAKLEERRREIIGEIDEDLIKFYELREASHGIDCSDSRFAELAVRLKELEEASLEARGKIKEIESEKMVVQRDLDRIPDVETEVKALESEAHEKESFILKLRELESLFQQTGLDIKKRLVPQIEAYFGWILPKMTRGRYHKVRLGDDFNIQVFSEEYGGYVDIENLSGGTVDQLLISLRLAFARAATAHSGSMSQFLFLDEPFSSFDEPRRELFFTLLETLKMNFQQIFLISHIPNLEDFVDHYIKLDLATEQPSVASWLS
ncbi:MAG TPA: SMC family ATPase [bacterium]|nr:SMC family ATPase [bacterium]